MNQKTKWFLILAAFIILVIISFIIRGQAKASVWECNQDYPCITPTVNPCDSWKDEDCITPTISPSEDVSPTAGVSATPTDFIYPTPTEGSGGYFDDHLGCGEHSCVGKPAYVPIPTGAPDTGRAIR